MPQAVEYPPTTDQGAHAAPDHFAGSTIYPTPKPPGMFGWKHHPADALPPTDLRLRRFGLFRDQHRFYAWDYPQCCACAALTIHGWIQPNGTPWEPEGATLPVFNVFIASIRDAIPEALRLELARVLAVAVGKAVKS